MPNIPSEHPATDTREAWLPIVVQKLHGLRYGVVQIVVHDSQVVQIERTERTRLDRPPGGPPDRSPGGPPDRSPESSPRGRHAG